MKLKEKINLKRVIRDRKRSGFAALFVKKEKQNLNPKKYIKTKIIKANKKYISMRIIYKDINKVKSITIKRWGVTNG